MVWELVQLQLQCWRWLTAEKWLLHFKKYTGYIFGQPFVKRFSYAIGPLSVCLSVYLSVLSVMLVCCGQTVWWIKMKLGMQGGLGPDHIVLEGDWAPLPQRGTAAQIFAHICCGQMAGWIKMPLGREVGLSPSNIVLDEDPAPLSKKVGIAPIFGPVLLWPNGWMDLCHLVCR